MSNSELLPNYVKDCAGEDIQNVLHFTAVEQVSLSENRNKKLYVMGDEENEPLILLPPVGMSFLLVSKLALVLSKQYMVLSWESVGCPDASEDFEEGQENLHYQVEEFAEMIKAKKLTKFHFVGWCQACQKIMKFHESNTHNATIKSITLLAPAGLGTSVLESEFNRCALPIYMQMSSRDESFAKQMSAILGGNKKPDTSDNTSGENISLVHLKAPETCKRFAKYMVSFDKERKVNSPEKYQVFSTAPTHIIHCKDDEFSHYSESVQLAKKVPSIHLTLLNKGGHLMMYKEPENAAGLIHERIQAANNMVSSSETLTA
jgi:hypothetical protein